MHSLNATSTAFLPQSPMCPITHRFIDTAIVHHTHKNDPHHLSSPQQYRVRLPPCRVTNEGKELRVKKLIQEAGIEDDEYMMVDPQNLGPNPELGPLERQVSVTFEEGLVQEEIDIEAMNYWFTEPEGGWQTEKRRLKKADSEPLEQFDDVRHHTNSADPSSSPLPGQPRRPLSDLHVGDVLQGTVVKQMLYHGIQVDVGYEADGLIPICELDQWRAVGDAAPDIDDVIDVVVYAVRDDPIFRFPLQLVPKDQYFASRIPPPDSYIPPLDLRDVPVTRYDEIAEKSGRKWEMQKVIVGRARDEDMSLEDGVMMVNDDVEWDEEEMRELDDIVAGKYF